MIGGGQYKAICLLVGLLWVGFCAFLVLIRGPDGFADDAVPLYRAAQLASAGDLSQLYDQPPGETTQAGHPFRFPPLAAWALSPVSALPEPVFLRGLLVLNLIAYAIALYIAAAAWRPALCHPLRYAAMLLTVAAAPPFQSAANLDQIQMIILLLMSGAIFLTWRSDGGPAGWWSSISAGGLVALASFVKITPAVLILAWLLVGQRRAAISALVGLCILGLADVMVIGMGPNVAFMAHTVELSGQVLAATNNQSLRSMANAMLHPAPYRWNLYPVSLDVQVIEATAALILAMCLGVMTSRLRRPTRQRTIIAFCLGAALVLAPVSWDHYYIAVPLLLMAVPPVWFGRGWTLCVTLIVLLNLLPISSFLIWRQFYAVTFFEVALFLTVVTRSPIDG